MSIRPFHLAFPVRDLEETRAFYVGVLGCGTGREDPSWIDFDLFGHQIVAHLDASMTKGVALENHVDGEHVPVPHFGVLLQPEQWRTMRDRLQGRKDVRWVIEPTIRFEGLPGEQATMFFLDPSGNALEFKSFDDDSRIFAKQ